MNARENALAQGGMNNAEWKAEAERLRHINAEMLVALRELTNVVDGSLRELMQTGNHHHGISAPVLRAAYDAIDKAEGRRPREFKSL